MPAHSKSAPSAPQDAPAEQSGATRSLLLSVILFEGGLFLALCAWLWSARHFPHWAAPVVLHPACRAFLSGLGILDIWAACDLLAERVTGETAP